VTCFATPRLDLVGCAPQLLLALIEHPDNFERLAGFPVSPELHGFYTSDAVSPKWLAALRQDSEPDPWRHGFFLLHRGDGLVIGSAGYKGPPDAEGIVEIAYGVSPEQRNRGYATEAAAALVAIAFRREDVRVVCAHTLPDSGASQRVLAKCGFERVGEVEDPEDGPVVRFEKRRSA
jgi:RimJ/RimL family protein N-acetyltransferase